ncbi:GNAT family N-acetyltransferase [Nocardioides cynanchi]|uniref:GNAT family N-acetyltransferase n=1 Tax=Nocardioides cynanchi TaxID=2558918 RepID=UPI0012471C1D|nr:GNAT family N-acetyltransferase [Nocardioides cynanchi]
MLWKVRATLADRPGALAELARSCGAAGVNILGLQIFPALGSVTDELILRSPGEWTTAEVARLLESAGASRVSVAPVTEAALVDQPTRYVEAARTVLDQPASFPEVVAALFDAEPDRPADDPLAALQDVLELTVREVTVQIRRLAPFTATEHARAGSLADLVNDVLVRHHPAADGLGHRADESATPEFGEYVDGARATVDDRVIGHATLAPVPDEDAVVAVDLAVDPAWRRRGIGTRLLRDAARLASSRRTDALVLTTRSDNQAVLAVVLASGLRGRIRMAGETLTVRIPLGGLAPRAAETSAAVTGETARPR